MPERALLPSTVFALVLVACSADVRSTEAPDASVLPSGEDAAAPGFDAATAAACSEATSPFVPAGGYTLALGALGTVFPAPGATGNMLAGQSNAGFGVDVVGADGKPLRKIFVNFSTHDDVANVAQTDGVVTSLDGAQTFGGYVAGVMSPPAFAIQRRDGRVLSYGFVPTVITTGAESTLTLQGNESTNDGNTWKAFAATVKLPKVGGSTGRLSGHPIQLSDGTLLIPYYGRSEGDLGGYRAELLASSDGGRTFVVRGNIAVPPAGESYPEADVVELQDGSLYSVFRHHTGPSLSPLLWARSTDAGVTWSKPAPVILPFDGAPSATRVGISPRLLLLPNGVLVLSSGRNDNFVAVSTEPNRVEWRDAKVTYVNYPTATTAGYGPDILRVHGSSGNTGLESLEANRALQFGDNCANGWGCPAADSGHTIDNRNRVWRRFIEVVTPDVGKIDLLSKFQRGLVHVASDMTWSSPAHSRARVDGAFDGSTEYWSSAVKQSGKGELTIQLDRTYELTRIGLSIQRGERASAAVYTSLDGVTFCSVPTVSAADRTHRAIEYFPLARPVSAAYVKVVTEASTSCGADLGASCSFLNELELYSTVDSFENDPVGSPPRGYTEASGVSVVMRTDGESRRVLRLTDVSDASIARAVWRSTPAEKKTLELSLRPLALASAFQFSLSGKDAAGGVVDAFRLGVFPDGSAAHYDAGAKAWIPLVKAGSIPVGRWSHLRVDATLDKITLLIDGSVVGTAPPTTQGAVALDTHAFASGGTTPSGDDVLIDDVYFR